MADTIDYAPRHRVERLVSAGRIVLAGCLCVGLVLDPGELGRHAAAVQAVASAYFGYAVVIGAWFWLATTTPLGLPLVTHVMDMVLFAVLMHLSGGPDNPFFVDFVFVTLCGAIRWHGRGALATGTVALALYVAVTTVGADSFGASVDWSRLAVRCVHLAMVAGLLAFLGAHHRRQERRLGLLTRWPRGGSASHEEAVRDILARAAETLASDRLVLLWEDGQEPWLGVAIHDRAGFQLASRPPDVFGEIVAERLKNSFMCEDVWLAPQPRAVVRTEHGFHFSRGAVISPAFRESFRPCSVLALRISSESVHGWLFAMDKTAMSTDDLVLGDVVGCLVAEALEVEVRLRQLRDNGASGERLRIARELHDGVLQALAGTALQVQAARDVLRLDPTAADQRLARVQDTLCAEQQALRRAVDTLNPRHGRDVPKTDSLAPLRECAHAIARQWDVRVRLKMPEFNRPMPQDLVHEICRMATEALVNAVRHGGAREIRLACDNSPTAVRLIVQYEGQGFVGLDGRHDLSSLSALGLGPRTLMQRVVALEGRLAIESHDFGARLEIDVPFDRVPFRNAILPAQGHAQRLRERAVARSS